MYKINRFWCEAEGAMLYRFSKELSSLKITTKIEICRLNQTQGSRPIFTLHLSP